MRHFIFDTETTDLLSNELLADRHQPHIIEFYGEVINDCGKVTDTLEFLCHPGFTIEPITTKITGIKPEDLEGKPPFAEFSERVADFIESSDVVVAHNLSFDMGVVNVEMRRCGQSLIWPEELICTVEQTEWIHGHRLNLSALHEHLFGEKFSGAHRAKNDVKALTRCYVELMKRGAV